VTPARPEFLALYGLDPAVYGAFDVSTQYNLATKVRMTGVEFDYKQALTFLPVWARGVQVFANASAQRATGEATANFSGYVPRSAAWGLSLSRPKYNVRANWAYRARQRGSQIASGLSIAPDTFNWTRSLLTLDVQGDYFLTKRISIFANLRNVTDHQEIFEIANALTPSHARFNTRENNGSLWTFGIRGTF
jgi:outer membrane receptor protein involved in Fe transport